MLLLMMMMMMNENEIFRCHARQTEGMACKTNEMIRMG